MHRFKFIFVLVLFIDFILVRVNFLNLTPPSALDSPAKPKILYRTKHL